MADVNTATLMAEPSLREAAAAVFSEEERTVIKDNLRSEQVAQAKYLRAHPEVHRAVQEGLARVLKAQPDDPVAFLTEYFTSDDLLAQQPQQ
ncbi:Dpy-30 motif/Regulatory subunit of type II PKA R-subunit [Novymonas esmeraldas]|uniref:Dpy-30 motif/Regulatory subunit of type II PKA R-subunit n=1 Tax=Novymonas esmeraldas TaxID=1808958 RepID=A0AAW0ER05_9TRYP